MAHPCALSIEDIREIFATHGEFGAKFRIGQTASRLGSEYAAPLRAEFDRLVRAERDADRHGFHCGNVPPAGIEGDLGHDNGID